MGGFSIAVLMAVVVCMTNGQSFAFVGSSTSSPRPSTCVAMESCSRRDAMFGIAAAAFVVVPQSASAKYSDYARREKDWEQRSEKGELKVSSARDLRSQLQEIVPQNSESSKIFCPNGQSSSVSPLMENKCGDRLATPSVYGRTKDTTGNSIPGFKDGYAWSPGEISSVSASVGGFPAYKENEWTIREKVL